jgi:hypothetical protein
LPRGWLSQSQDLPPRRNADVASCIVSRAAGLSQHLSLGNVDILFLAVGQTNKREQAGQHPALILSQDIFNER